MDDLHRDLPTTAVLRAIGTHAPPVEAGRRALRERVGGAARWPTLLDLLAERRRRGITILDGGDRLVIEDPHGMLTPDFAAALAARRDEFLGLLRDCATLKARAG